MAGAGTYFVPNAIFALRLYVATFRPGGSGPVLFLIGEMLKVGAAVGSGVGRVAPENVAGCGEQTALFVGCAWASTRAPVHKPGRRSRRPPRASMHVEALVMTALQDDLADWTGKR